MLFALCICPCSVSNGNGLFVMFRRIDNSISMDILKSYLMTCYITYDMFCLNAFLIRISDNKIDVRIFSFETIHLLQESVFAFFTFKYFRLESVKIITNFSA